MPTMTSTRPGGPEIVAGAVVATLGILLALDPGGPFGYYALDTVLAGVVVALATGGIVTISRILPGLALTLVWLMAVMHVLTGTSISYVEVAFAAVAFTTARWGSSLVATLGGLSILGAGVLAFLATVAYRVYNRFDLIGLGPRSFYDTLLGVQDRLGNSAYVVIPLGGAALLGIPWLVGIALRFSDRATASQAGQVAAEEVAAQAQRESEQAREIARLRDDQARLARDVHDVVGHSLAVILAQAESAQYAADGDTEKLKATLATIATSARASLQDVRHVLTTASGEQPTDVAPRPLDTLVEGIRASGHEVVSRELGTPQPMPPDLEVVAYRVLQEMLTNAIRHGSRDEPVFVERHWPDGSWAGELRIEVRNSLSTRGTEQATTDETQPLTALGTSAASSPTDEGRGLEGMRRRLEACGGRLDVRRREGTGADEPATFTTTAWVPVRTVSP